MKKGDMENILKQKGREKLFKLYKQKAKKCTILETQLNVVRHQLMEMKGF